MYRIVTLLLFVVSAVGVAAAGGKPISPPKFIPIQFPGAASTQVYAINNSGAMVGFYSSPQHGFAIVGSKVFTIDVPLSMGNDTACWGINSAGSIVGQYTSQQGTLRGFLYQNGKYSDIGPAGYSYAAAINDLGEIVGQSGSSGFLWDGTQYQLINVQGSSVTLATGINNEGTIVLQWSDSENNVHSSLFDGTTYTNIDVPGAVGTYAYNINNAGDVAVMWADDSKPFAVQHGALLHNGQYHTFMVPGANRTFVSGINDFDFMAGASWAQGVTTGYKLIP